MPDRCRSAPPPDQRRHRGHAAWQPSLTPGPRWPEPPRKGGSVLPENSVYPTLQAIGLPFRKADGSSASSMSW